MATFKKWLQDQREETASLHLSLEEEIDQFKLKEEGEVRADPVEISDTKGELDRTAGVRTPCLILAQIDNSFEKEEEETSLNPRKCLKDLLARKTKGSSSKEAPKSQLPSSLPPHPPSITDLLAIPNLKKKIKEQKVKEGEVIH